MKRTYIILIGTLIAGICVLQACRKTDSPSHVAVISYPVITLQGAQFITINNGATWNDPGATWKDTVTGESGNVTVAVNTSKDSAYYLVYTATNKNGFQAHVWRGLAVTNQSNNTDISGAYVFTDSTGPFAGAFGLPDTLYKVSRAFFMNPDIDLSGDTGLIAVKSDSTISVAMILTSSTSSGTGSLVPEFFKHATISYTPSVFLQYNDSINYQPTLSVAADSIRLLHQ